MRRLLIPFWSLLLGTALIVGLYFGILTWAQDWKSAAGQFSVNRWYVIPIWVIFGFQAALYSILRFRLFAPVSVGAATTSAGAMVSTSGVSSTTAMVACCLHHATDALPILGLSAAATFLTRYQRPFMLVSLGMEIAGALIMLAVIYRERRRLRHTHTFKPVLEPR